MVTRLTHWLNVFRLSFLLLSGLQLFNAYPRLHWGQYGADERNGEPRGFISIGGMSIPTTGVLDLSKREGEWTPRAFPGWFTLPSYQDLAAGRRWHFFFAWLLVINGFVYLTYNLLRLIIVHMTY
jgi:thiosulfate reductase cytochrome b subunit